MKYWHRHGTYGGRAGVVAGISRVREDSARLKGEKPHPMEI